MTDGLPSHRLLVDLHCHSAASFDGSVDPARLVRLARERGLTHLAVTDHDTVAGALAARAAAPDGLTVIVGQEMRTVEGDIIALFVERDIPSGLALEASVALVHELGGLVGLAHPFDAYRPSVGRGAMRSTQLQRLAQLADYVEVHNGRVADEAANARAADFAREYGLAAVAVSDAHREAEVGTAATTVTGRIACADDLRRSLEAEHTLAVREHYPEAEGAVRRWMGRLRR